MLFFAIFRHAQTSANFFLFAEPRPPAIAVYKSSIFHEFFAQNWTTTNAFILAIFADFDLLDGTKSSVLCEAKRYQEIFKENASCKKFF